MFNLKPAHIFDGYIQLYPPSLCLLFDKKKSMIESHESGDRFI